MKKRGNNCSKAKVATRPHQPQTSRRAGERRTIARDDTARRLPVGLKNGNQKRTTVAAYQADERVALAILLMPFLLLAMVLGVSQSLKVHRPWLEATIARPLLVTPNEVAQPLPSIILALPQLVLPRAAPIITDLKSEIEIRSPIAIWPPEQPLLATREINQSRSGPFSVPVRGFELAANAPIISSPVLQSPVQAPSEMPQTTPLVCLPTPAQAPMSPGHLIDPENFGIRLAAAAEQQTKGFVIYSARYKKINFPMGDVSPLYGACTDVIVRAYRALGIDLQDLVQRSRVGQGDANIDHRRTETLRTYFVRNAQVLPVSSFPEDYKPGDIVTYYRPFSRVSRAHIALVSGVIGPNRRPLIIHNRGWGPQLEDALFVDKITGHYRLHPSSMLQLASKSTQPAATHLRTASFGASIARTRQISDAGR